MTVIYAVKSGTIVKRKSSHLSFCKVDENGRELEIAKRPVEQLEVLYVFGRVTVTSEALKLCMSHGVDVNFFNRNYKYIGTSNANNFKGLDLKMLQFQNYADPVLRLNNAKNIVDGKIRNQISTLKYVFRHNQNADVDQNDFSRTIQNLERNIDSLRGCNNYQSVLGIEGTSSREYFGMFGRFFTGELKFSTRSHHPARDPVNALLSLGYCMLTNILTGFIISRGLEAGLGCLHSAQTGRESLALDLVEQFRAPIVDRLVSKYCNLKKFSRDMFCTDENSGNVKFRDNCISRFFEIWDKHIHLEYRSNPLNTREHPVRNLIELLLYQVDEYAASLRNNRPYKSYSFNWYS